MCPHQLKVQSTESCEGVGVLRLSGAATQQLESFTVKVTAGNMMKFSRQIAGFFLAEKYSSVLIKCSGRK